MIKKNPFWQMIFLKNPMPVCILEEESWIVLEANHAFERLTGYSLAEMLESKMKLENILYKKDLRNFKTRIEHSEGKEHVQGELRMISKEHNIKEVEIEIQRIIDGKKRLLLCSLYDISHRKEIEEELRQKIQEKHDKIVDSAKNFLQMKSLLEKMNPLPILLQQLWKCDSLEQLAQKVVLMLTQQKGFHYTLCSFFSIEGDCVKLLFSNQDCALHRFDINKGHKIAQVARGDMKIVSSSTGEYIFPIVSSEKILGVLQLFLDETERSVIAENEDIHNAHCCLLESMGEFLGLLIANIHLTEEKNYYRDYEPVYNLYNKAFLLKRIEEYKEKKIFALIFLFYLEGQDFCLLERKSVEMESFSHILQQYKPENSYICMVSAREIALVIENISFPFVEWSKEIRIHFKKNHPLLSISIGIVNSKNSDIGNTIYACISESLKKGGNKTFFWDQEKKQLQEILEKIVSRLE